MQSFSSISQKDQSCEDCPRENKIEVQHWLENNYVSSVYSDSTTPLYIAYLGSALAPSPPYSIELALSPTYRPVLTPRPIL